jgi:hypothetical protein
MGVPPGNRAQRRRLRRVQGVGSEAYLNGTSQEPTPEDARKDGQIPWNSPPALAIGNSHPEG